MPQNDFPWTGGEAPTFDEIQGKPATYPPRVATQSLVGGVLEATHSAANAAVIPANAPAGGTGSALGGWDTAADRDAAIATINALVTAVSTLKASHNDLLTKLTNAGIVSAT